MRRALHRFTCAEYAALETVASEKHEFLEGEIYMMAGGSEEHSALAASIVRLLGNSVTSDSSVDYDTETKLEFCRTIPSLREYAIVSHSERRVTVHARDADGFWKTTDSTRGGNIELPSLGATLRR